MPHDAIDPAKPPKHMPRYLDEFVYRFDRRWRETEVFGFMINRALGAEMVRNAG